MRTTLTALAIAIGCCAAGAHAASAPIEFSVRPGGWVCQAYGWLKGATDRDRQERGHCMAAIIDALPVVPMDVSLSGMPFVCLPVRGAPGGAESSLFCGYVLAGDLVDAQGRPARPDAVRAASIHATMQDVWRLP